MTDSVEQLLPRMVLEALPLGVYVVNRQSKIILWSAGAEQLTGYLRQDVLGRLLEEELWDETAGEPNLAQANLVRPVESLPEGHALGAQKSLRGKHGRLLPVHLQSVPIRDDLGKILGVARIFQPVSAPENAERRQDKLGAYGCLDALTGLLNHSMIQAHLKECLSLYALYPVPFCVICYSVDDLPKLRDRYGQAAADATLRIVAQTIENGLHQTDFLGRWLDQEFLAILTECGEAEVFKVGQRLNKLVQHTSVPWWGDTLHATVSIGATMVHDNDSVSTLVSRAEEALRESSSGGGNRVVVVSA